LLLPILAVVLTIGFVSLIDKRRSEVHKASEIELLVKVDVAVAVVLYTKSSMKWELG